MISKNNSKGLKKGILDFVEFFQKTKCIRFYILGKKMSTFLVERIFFSILLFESLLLCRLQERSDKKKRMKNVYFVRILLANIFRVSENSSLWRSQIFKASTMPVKIETPLIIFLSAPPASPVPRLLQIVFLLCNG